MGHSKHNESWRFFSEKLTERKLSGEELEAIVHGRTNRSILRYLLGTEMDDDKIEALSLQKEQIYRDLFKKNKRSLKFVSGVEDLPDYLVEHQIPRTIATGSEKTNVDFYIETFNH